MTENKPIMIDGVDVSECVYYKQECIANCGMFALGDFKCEGQICLYKQLKRKEQECEELKEKAKELRQGWINCDKERNLQEANSEFRKRIIDRYKQAFDEIEKSIKDYCKYMCMAETMEICEGCQNTESLDIINKAKEWWTIMEKSEEKITHIINIVNIEGEPIVTRSYTVEAFLNMCNDKLHTNYTIEESNEAMRAFLDKYNYLEIHINPLITEEEPVDKYKQTLIEIKEIAEPFCNACQEHEPEKSGRDCMYCNYGKILQKISECKGEYNEKIR